MNLVEKKVLELKTENWVKGRVQKFLEAGADEGWLEVNLGPYIALFIGFRQCLLDPMKNKPEDFFDAFFD